MPLARPEPCAEEETSEQQRPPRPASEPAAAELETVRKSCSRAVRAGKSHLQVCLKLLGILYRTDGEGGLQRGMTVKDGGSLAKNPGGDELYLAMVMLNSSLLKALHVVDSFQMHCQQELPKALANYQEEVHTDDEWALGVMEEEEDTEAGEHKDADGKAALASGCDVAGELYRRLQAQCVVLAEAARSLEQQRLEDERRLPHLDEECTRLRVALKTGRPVAAKAILKQVPPRAVRGRAEAVSLGGKDFDMERQANGDVVISEANLQAVMLHAQALRSTAQEARGEESAARSRCEAAAWRIQEALREEDELAQMLGCAGPADLHSSLAQLLADLREDSMYENGLAPVTSSSDSDRHPVCRLDRFLPPHRPSDEYEESLLAQPPGVSPTPAGERPRRVDVDGHVSRSNSTSGLAAASIAVPVVASVPGTAGFGRVSQDGHPPQLQRQQLQPRTQLQPQMHMHQLTQPFPSASSTASAAASASRGRKAASGRAPSAQEAPSRKLVACSSTPSNLPLAHRRAAYGALMEERQITRAALRYAKSPDSQALDRLASLLGQGGAAATKLETMGYAGTSASTSVATSGEDAQLAAADGPCGPAPHSVQSLSLPTPSPPSPAMAATGAVATKGGTRTAGPPAPAASLHGPPRPQQVAMPWQMTRMTWPTPEQRARAVSASAGQPHVDARSSAHAGIAPASVQAVSCGLAHVL